MGTACRGGTVDACFVHNVTYMPVWFILYFVFRTLHGCNPTRGVANKHASLSSFSIEIKYFFRFVLKMITLLQSLKLVDK